MQALHIMLLLFCHILTVLTKNLFTHISTQYCASINKNINNIVLESKEYV